MQNQIWLLSRLKLFTLYNAWRQPLFFVPILKQPAQVNLVTEREEPKYNIGLLKRRPSVQVSAHRLAASPYLLGRQRFPDSVTLLSKLRLVLTQHKTSRMP
jgi:hypothetical protein